MNKIGILLIALIGMGTPLYVHCSLTASAAPTRKDISALYNELDELSSMLTAEAYPLAPEACSPTPNENPITTDKCPSDQTALIALINRGFADDELITFAIALEGFKRDNISFNEPQNSLSLAIRNAYLCLIRVASLLDSGALSGDNKQKDLARVNQMLHYLHGIKKAIEHQYV